MSGRPWTVCAVQSHEDHRWRIHINDTDGRLVAVGHRSFATRVAADRAALDLSCVQFYLQPSRPIKKDKV